MPHRKADSYRPPKKVEPEEARALILQWMKDLGRPVLVGQVALHIGRNFSLSDAETLLARMAHEGVIRHATKAELRSYDYPEGYVLVTKT